MTTAIVYSGLLVLSFILLFSTESGRLISIGVRLLPLAALALLWIHTLFFRIPGRKGLASGILIGLTYFLAYPMVFAPAVGSLALAFLDRTRRLPVEVFGGHDAAHHLTAIYHPGASGFTQKVVRQVCKSLAHRGFHVEMKSAFPGSVDGAKDAVLLASPIYGGRIRPPLMRVIKSVPWPGRRAFLVLTGSDPDNERADLQRAGQIVTDLGGEVRSGVKLITHHGDDRTKERIEGFISGLTKEME
jgi:hypothetical protein